MDSGRALNRRSNDHAVEGFLILHAGGYGCVQPWPVFGHLSLDDHWGALADGVSLPLLDQALACAKEDASARASGVSWWADIQVPRSHATITDWQSNLPQDIHKPFTHAKIKVSIVETEVLHDWALRHPEVRLRLDCNEVPSMAEFDAWWHGLDQELRNRIDWIEDPFSYDAEKWSQWQKKNTASLAVDRAFDSGEMSASCIAIWKPAWQPLPQGAVIENVVVTSAMDHPVGQAWAAFSAACSGVESICGLRTDHLFARNEFTECLGSWSPEWPSIPGTGMGFDDLLEKIPWKRIR